MHFITEQTDVLKLKRLISFNLLDLPFFVFCPYFSTATGHLECPNIP